MIDFQDLLGMKMNPPSLLILDCKTFTTSEKNLTEENLRAKWMNETKFFPVFVDPLLSYAAFLAAIEIQREFMEHNNMLHSKDDDINKIRVCKKNICLRIFVFEEKLIQRNDKSKV